MKKIMLFAAACVALVACSKTEIKTTSFKKGQVVTISASSDLNGGTKVTGTDDGTNINFKWETGDKVKVTVGTESAEFTLKTGAGTTNATFEGTMPADGNTFDMQYPVDTPDLSIQDYVSADQIPHNKMLFTAGDCTLDKNAGLKPQYALLKLNFYTYTGWDELNPVDSIVVSYQLSSEEGRAKLFVNPAVSLDYSEEASKPFYIIVPADISDVTVTINGEESLTIPTGIVFTKGNCINMDPCEVCCFAAGTLITLADGTTKKVEEIVEGDMVRTFDHEAGCISSQKICLTYKGDNKVTPLNLTFASGKTLSIVGTHDLLFEETLKYVRINSSNVKSYVGKQFYNAETGKWDELVSYGVGNEPVEFYCIYSAYHLNCVAEGMLTCPDDVDFLLNIYELNSNLKADPTQLATDILKYGLWDFAKDYPEYAEYAKLWDELQFKYKDIAKGKGLVTKAQMYELLNYWNN